MLPHIKSYVSKLLCFVSLLGVSLAQAQIKSSYYAGLGLANTNRQFSLNPNYSPNPEHSPRFSSEMGIRFDKSFFELIHVQANLGLQHYSFRSEVVHTNHVFFTKLDWNSQLTYAAIGISPSIQIKKFHVYYGFNLNYLLRSAMIVDDYLEALSPPKVVRDIKAEKILYVDMPRFLLFMQGHLQYQLNSSWAIAASYSRSLGNPWNGSNYASTDDDRIFSAWLGFEYYFFQK